MPIIEKRYAQALLNSSKTIEEKEFFRNGLNEISELYSSNMQFKKILLDPRLGSEVKLNIVKEIFPKYDNKLFMSFMGLLMDKNRINTIEGIANEYAGLNRLLKNEINIKIISADTLNNEDIDKITEKYKRLYKAGSVKYEIKKDESLIGGVKVIVGNKVYDGSIKTQIKGML